MQVIILQASLEQKAAGSVVNILSCGEFIYMAIGLVTIISFVMFCYVSIIKWISATS